MIPMTGTELRVAIAALGLNQEGFGQTFRIPKRTLARYLSGSGQVPDQLAMLVRIMVARRNWNDLLSIGYGSPEPIKYKLGLSPAD